jgi:pilus assembly protein Flp/PilA
MPCTVPGVSKASRRGPKGDPKMKSTLLTSFFQDESGATAIEYGLIAALISIVIITAITAIGTQLTKTFTTVSNTLSTANN